MVKKTYKELLDSLKYSDLGYTGERKPLTDPKYKQFTDTINKNTVIANTHIDSSLPQQMPQAQVDGKNPWVKNRRNAGFQDPKGAEISTVGSETTVGGVVPTETPQPAPTTDTPLTIDAKYSDFVNWAKQNGVDSDKVFQDAMALARTQYEQSRATYGMKAEQLAQAGLTNSGVSDNLERAAYAQKVQAEQAALDQKAALDQANKQAYGAYKEQQRQQYTDLFQKYVFGYEDEFGNIHAPVSPDEAVALLKLAGLTDDAMIADLRKSYDDYKGVADKKAQEQQFAIAGIDSTTGGFSADSMFGKLFDTSDSTAFLNEVATKYDIQADTDEEAVEALLANKLITKEQSSLYYKNIYENTLNTVVSQSKSAQKVLKNAESDLYTTVKSAKEAYESGKMNKSDWENFRNEILDGNGISFSRAKLSAKRQYGMATISFKINGTEQTADFPAVKISSDTSHLNSLEKNGIAIHDGKVYVKLDEKTWYGITDDGTKTIKTSMYQILSLLG